MSGDGFSPLDGEDELLLDPLTHLSATCDGRNEAHSRQCEPDCRRKQFVTRAETAGMTVIWLDLHERYLTARAMTEDGDEGQGSKAAGRRA